MSRFRKLSQTIWHCQYHMMWTPKYRYRVLTDQLGLDVDSCIRAFSEQLKLCIKMMIRAKKIGGRGLNSELPLN